MEPSEPVSSSRQDSGSSARGGDAGGPVGRTPLSEWFRLRRARFAWCGFVFSLLFLLLWPYVVVTIFPGHVGVLYHRFLGGTVMDRIYSEGTHLVLPWDRMYIFDARIHEEMHTFSVLSKNGLTLEVDVSVLYHPNALRTPVLLTSVGQDYREKLVLPTLFAAVRNIASQHDKSDFYDDTSRQIQDSMYVHMVEAIGRNPVTVDNLFLRAVRLPVAVNQAIDEKFVAEQQVQRQMFKVQEAVQRYKTQFIDAQAVRMTQDIVNRNMSENFLRWQGIEATKALAASPGSKFVIIGGKDGLPVILNPDGPAAPAADKPEGPRLPGSGKAPGPVSALPPPGTPPGEGITEKSLAATFMDRIGALNLDKALEGIGGLATPSPGPSSSVEMPPPSPGGATGAR